MHRARLPSSLSRRLLPLALLLPLVAACGERDRNGDGHGRDEEDHASHEAHAPRMGGILVDLDHVVQVEFVHDAAKGTLAAYVWDGHVEKAAPADQREVEVTLQPGEIRLVLPLVSSGLLGDRFEAASEKLRGATFRGGTLKELRALGRSWSAVRFRLGADGH